MRKENEFSENSYRNIGIDQLIIYAVSRILESNEECTFERLVYEAYMLFPLTFGFQRYPEWPDSARINKSWLRCRTDRGWLEGNVKMGFRLTQSGKMMAKKTGNELKGETTEIIEKPQKATRERYESIISYIKNFSAYIEYLKNDKYEISHAELISFLGGTLETPKRILRQNLNLYYDAARIYDDSTLLPFLNMCKNRLIKLGR